MLTGSIDLTKIGELVKSGHPAVQVGKNGKKYLNLTLWINDKPNEWDQIASLSAYDKETKKSEYFGNLKEWADGGAQNPNLTEPEDEDLPF